MKITNIKEPAWQKIIVFSYVCKKVKIGAAAIIHAWLYKKFASFALDRLQDESKWLRLIAFSRGMSRGIWLLTFNILTTLVISDQEIQLFIKSLSADALSPVDTMLWEDLFRIDPRLICFTCAKCLFTPSWLRRDDDNSRLNFLRFLMISQLTIWVPYQYNDAVLPICGFPWTSYLFHGNPHTWKDCHQIKMAPGAYVGILHDWLFYQQPWYKLCKINKSLLSLWNYTRLWVACSCVFCDLGTITKCISESFPKQSVP